MEISFPLYILTFEEHDVDTSEPDRQPTPPLTLPFPLPTSLETIVGQFSLHVASGHRKFFVQERF